MPLSAKAQLRACRRQTGKRSIAITRSNEITADLDPGRGRIKAGQSWAYAG